MTRSSPPQVAFSAGEIDPLLRQRFDYQRFQTGLAECHGFLPLPQGGATRAPGTTHLGITRGNVPAVLVPFVFSANDAAILEFTPGFMRVWRYDDLVLDGMTPYELATPYGADSLPRLQCVQSADVIYLCDGLQPIQRLARTALDAWTIGPKEFKTGPFRVQNLDEALTMQASATTGAITLTASTAFFQAAHVGSLVQLKPTDFTTIPLWTSNETLAPGDKRRYGPNVYELTLGTNAKTNPPIHEQGEALTDNGVKWRFVSDGVGVVRITSVAGPLSAGAEVIKTVPEACVIDPTYRFSEGAWSNLYGYPATIEIYDQRLAAGATPADPRTVWFSTIGDYGDFTPGTEADSSFAYALAGKGAILTIRTGKNGLHLFAESSEYASRSETNAQAIGPTTAVFSLTGTLGTSGAQPIAPHGDPIMITRGSTQLASIAYSLQADGNRARILSRASQHIAKIGMQQIAWQQTPEPRAWIRLATGELAAMIFDEDEEVLGWSTHSVGTLAAIGGARVLDLAATQNEDGSEDRIFLVAVRTTASGTYHCVERLDPSHHLHGAIARPSDSAEVTTLSLPWHAGAQLTVWHSEPRVSDDPTVMGTHEEYTVTVEADGTANLAMPMPGGVIGQFVPDHAMETLDIQAAAPDGSSLGRLKRLHSPLAIGVYETQGGFAQVVEAAKPNETARYHDPIQLLPRAIGFENSRAFTGVIETRAPSGQARGVSVRVVPEGNAALTITGIIPTVQEAGR